MSDEGNAFKGTIDRYNGVTIDTKEESIDINTFPELLKSMTSHDTKISISYFNDLAIISDLLESWRLNSKRTIWFKVQTSDSQIVPTLVEVKCNSTTKKNQSNSITKLITFIMKWP